ncbi:MAG: hypothetical protein HQ555_07800 [Candidatus Aminicenantes bacterium]|nr:hypothetical protein [Candidatus Aminicenantes bacterium]
MKEQRLRFTGEGFKRYIEDMIREEFEETFSDENLKKMIRERSKKAAKIAVAKHRGKVW